MLATAPAAAQQKSVKIGFVSTFSGPTAVIGNDMRNSFELGLDHIGRKMGGLPVEVIYENDEQRPEVGRQKTEKLIQSDRVNFVVGYIWSNVLLASLKPVIDSQTFLISSNAGPASDRRQSLLAVLLLDLLAERPDAAGHGPLHEPEGASRALYLIGPNYAAGKDMLSGVRSTYRGKIVGEDLTRWPDQLDFSTELSKVRTTKPEAVFVFYPGAAGVQFLNQYVTVGPARANPALYRVHHRLDHAAAAEGPRARCSRRAALGQRPAERRQQEVRRRLPRQAQDYPSFYGAQSYDAVGLLNSAVTAVKGNLADKDGMRNEMRKANYASVRGPYRYGNNHFPIQNFYLQDVVKDADGNLTLKTVETIVENNQDRFLANVR